MIKVFITEGDACPYDASFDGDVFEIVDDTEEADIICFSGGSDLHPCTVGRTSWDTSEENNTKPIRDLYEWYLVNKYSGVKPLIGICRGFQFLSVLDGYTLVSDSPDHAGMSRHLVSAGYNVPSCHHQFIAKPVPSQHIMEDARSHVTCPSFVEGGIEAVYAPNSGWFGAQWHPYVAKTWGYSQWGYTWFNLKVIHLYTFMNANTTQHDEVS